MKRQFFLVFLMVITVSVSASVSPAYFVRGATSLSVSISSSSASIDVGESVEFNSTVTGGTSPYAFQWFLDGFWVYGATLASWTFKPPSSGTYSVYLRVNDSASNVVESEPVQVIVGGHSITGLFGYSNSSSGAGGSGTQYTTSGSRFMLNLEANITSISCLMENIDHHNPDQVYNYSFAIYRDNDGSVGSLVAQTVIGQIAYYDNVPLWYTLSFPSVVQLEPGGYWLMEVDDSIGKVMKHSDVIDGYESVSSYISNMTFPALLPSPILSSNHVDCIYASWDVAVNAALSEGDNVFSVTSNSTISSLTYNSATNELSFEVSGPINTAGYTEVFIPKILLANSTVVKATLDGKQINYSASSTSDFWCLHFVYSHSTHDVVINMQPEAIPEFPEQIDTINAVIILAVISAGLALLIYFIKRK